MAVTPEQAKRLKPEDEGQVKSLEAAIDRCLLGTDADYRGGWRHNLPEGTSEKATKALINMYEAAGWEVKRERGDQREPGDALYLRQRYSQQDI